MYVDLYSTCYAHNGKNDYFNWCLTLRLGLGALTGLISMLVFTAGLRRLTGFRGLPVGDLRLATTFL